jgi:hypothetical protein
VYEFIKNNPNHNQSDIVRDLKGTCTRLPVLDAICELTSDKDGREPKVKFSRNMPKGFYRYYVNDKNEFYSLGSMIDKMLQNINISIPMFRNLSSSRIFEYERGYLEHVKDYQLEYYAILGHFAGRISLIQDRDDRETLNLRLAEVLVLLNKLSTITLRHKESTLDNVKKRFAKLSDFCKDLDPIIKNMKLSNTLDPIELQRVEETLRRHVKDFPWLDPKNRLKLRV